MPIYFGLASRNLPITLESIGNHWDQEPIRRPNGYPYYHWLQTETGCGRITVGDAELCLGEGDGILIAPFEPHAYSRATTIWRTSFATFFGELETGIAKIVGHGPYHYMESQAPAWIDGIIAMHEARQLDEVRLSVDCYDFLLRLTHHRKRQEVANHPLYQQYVVPVIKTIETRYHTALNIRGLADSIFISPQYLNRLFKRFLDCTVYSYLTNYRINKAKELLVDRSNLEIQQIAYRVGFNDTSHFIAVFKKVSGHSPLAFRKVYR